MACVCRVLKREEERTLSAFKLVNIAKDCGKPVPARRKCGSRYHLLFILFLRNLLDLSLLSIC
jgi:hypothetical protein